MKRPRTPGERLALTFSFEEGKDDITLRTMTEGPEIAMYRMDSARGLATGAQADSFYQKNDFKM
jgi:hypothetical protein